MVAKCTAVLTKIVPTYPELGNVGCVSRVISKSNLAEVRIVIAEGSLQPPKHQI